MSDLVPSDDVWRRQAFLAEATTLLSSSLDADWYLQGIADLAVPRFADWCIIERLDGADELSVCAEAHRAGRCLAAELRAQRPSDGGSPYGVSEALRTGRGMLLANLDQAIDDRRTRDPEDLRIYASLGVRSALIVPMTAENEVVAVMRLFSLRDDRRYTRADLRAVEELACTASAALAHSRSFRRADEVLRASGLLLSATTCHELRTPMSALLLQLESLEHKLAHDLGTLDVETIHTGIAKALAQARRLGSKLSELLQPPRGSESESESEKDELP